MAEKPVEVTAHPVVLANGEVSFFEIAPPPELLACLDKHTVVTSAAGAGQPWVVEFTPEETFLVHGIMVFYEIPYASADAEGNLAELVMGEPSLVQQCGSADEPSGLHSVEIRPLPPTYTGLRAYARPEAPLRISGTIPTLETEARFASAGEVPVHVVLFGMSMGNTFVQEWQVNRKPVHSFGAVPDPGQVFNPRPIDLPAREVPSAWLASRSWIDSWIPD